MIKPKNGSTLCLLLTAPLLLSACSLAPSSAVSPALARYSRPVQAMAAQELSAMKPPCAGDVANEHCSAVHRMIIDYGDLRERVRVLQK